MAIMQVELGGTKLEIGRRAGRCRRSKDIKSDAITGGRKPYVKKYKIKK